MGYPSGITKTILEFQYFSPKTLAEATSFLDQGGIKVLAGGTDLLIMLKKRAINLDLIINIKSIQELHGIREDDGALRIGALNTISEIGRSEIIKEKYTSLFEATQDFAAVQIRNMATIGGNICRSSPSADTLPPLISLNASLELVGAKGTRTILLEDFFTGPGTNILDNEILTEITIPMSSNKYGTAFAKAGRNSGDLAKVNCAVRIVVAGNDKKCEDISIVLGAVGPTPIRAKKAEHILRGKQLNDDLIEMVAEKVIEDIRPITDVRSTDSYRKEISKVFVKRLIDQSINRSNT